MIKRTTERLSAAEWAERVERWTRSGKGAKEFAATIGVKPYRLSWWKWHLSKRALGSSQDRVALARKAKRCWGAPEPKGAESLFLPVRVKGKAAVPAGATKVDEMESVTGSRTLAGEIVLADGTVIRLPNNCSPQWIADVLGALQKATRTAC